MLSSLSSLLFQQAQDLRHPISLTEDLLNTVPKSEEVSNTFDGRVPCRKGTAHQPSSKDKVTANDRKLRKQGGDGPKAPAFPEIPSKGGKVARAPTKVAPLPAVATHGKHSVPRKPKHARQSADQGRLKGKHVETSSEERRQAQVEKTEDSKASVAAPDKLPAIRDNIGSSAMYACGGMSAIEAVTRYQGMGLSKNPYGRGRYRSDVFWVTRGNPSLVES
ncbi:hypothetical protein CYMTET_51975 [Cymbomonas tetramitiformis]|uniref:Uncharacterized protein n=1 Tax=Cymbomonas tetramitiformis TaxID=36881 RepID=A0AAE0ERJ6_9CHLO|nr:hypothetical protein CYMTET_51975 [Cymbomonas tetramitiformis]